MPSKIEHKFIPGLGRRKTAVASVRLMSGKGSFSINGKELKEYFPTGRFQSLVIAPLKDTQQAGAFDVTAVVRGGGVAAQAGAVRLGIARALVTKDENWRKLLRVGGHLTRDPRMVERKKYGLKKARKSPQWSKR